MDYPHKQVIRELDPERDVLEALQQSLRIYMDTAGLKTRAYMCLCLEDALCNGKITFTQHHAAREYIGRLLCGEELLRQYLRVRGYLQRGDLHPQPKLTQWWCAHIHEMGHYLYAKETRMTAMKKVRITIGALTRVEYQTTQEVPVDATDAEIRELAEDIYENLDGDEFVDDPHYWERGEITWEEE